MKKKNLLGLLILFFGLGNYAFAQNCYCPSNTEPGKDLVVNGDFSDGNTGFSSDMPYVMNCQSSSYGVGNEPHTKCANSAWTQDLWDNTQGDETGSYLIVDGFSSTPSINRIWHQNVNVTDGKSYIFRFWLMPRVQNWAGNLNLEVFANGTSISGPIDPPTNQQWIEYCFEYEATETGSIEISINQLAPYGVSNRDFGIDDISFTSCNSLSKPCDVDAKFDFEVDPKTCEVDFINLSSGGLGTTIVGYQWTFGDGYSSTGINPSHFYPSSGSYDVCLTVYGIDENGDCCFDQRCFKIEVNCDPQDCKAEINGILYSHPVPPSCTFQFGVNYTANEAVVGYLWTIDGTTYTQTHPTHTFTSSGKKEVCVTMIFDSGSPDEKCCTAEKCIRIDVACGHQGHDQGFIEQQTEFIEAESKDKLLVFPNPATETVNLAFDTPAKANYTLSILNLQGQEMLNMKGEAEKGSSNLELNCQNLAKGTYFIRMVIGEKLLSEKLIIQ